MRGRGTCDPRLVSWRPTVDKRKRPDHPHGHHGYCGAYADAIADVVRRADRHIFRAFNYTTCCGAAT